MDISDIRTEYVKYGLQRADLANNPLDQFTTWFSQARAAELAEVNAMSLATADANGRPDVRTVLLKIFDEQGFVFFTNYKSAKARQLQDNPQAALLFPWLALERQVRITGSVEKISAAESFKYFSSRPRGSQLGAWISEQSHPIKNREKLNKLFHTIKERFKEGEIPLPSHWGGYRVIPNHFEFWQGRSSRLHDRFSYTKTDKDWLIERLAP
ncbi:pyridoxamine 5'-phosphate oxidase [Marinicella gelatinilytica]|uniref:pyridoxamine 5'-phosphate oxidase n=1 Tax=Marinicella gelatinilytica TaxID=2996017 RepID=UPI002260927E|nr:pyridoxamine 5'-phosphate oxidase [Marinicella gelatinilytica]MCX7543794.1 pyridoxamine 5'-phosphate oxidase [Marinicella gelatinilytica]